MKNATNNATVILPINPGIMEKVRIGTRTVMAIAEASPGRIGWSSGCGGERGVEGEGVVDTEV